MKVKRERKREREGGEGERERTHIALVHAVVVPLGLCVAVHFVHVQVVQDSRRETSRRSELTDF